MRLLCFAPLLILADRSGFMKALVNLGESPEHKLTNIIKLVSNAISLEQLIDLKPTARPTGIGLNISLLKLSFCNFHFTVCNLQTKKNSSN